VDLGLVVPGSGLARERQRVGPAPILDGEEAFGNVQVGRAVLAHGAELHQVGLRTRLPHGEQDVQRGLNVVDLREDRVLHVHHAVGGRRLLAQVDEGLRLERAQHVEDEVVVAEVAAAEIQALTETVVEGLQPLGHPADRGRGLRADLGHPVSPEVGVDAGHLVPALGQGQGQRPAQIAIDSGNEHPHHSPP
jgi:hypothetical protein